MRVKNRILTFLRKVFYWKTRRVHEKEILRDLEMIYEMRKMVYEFNCKERSILAKGCSKGDWLHINPEEILNMELYFSMDEIYFFQKIGLDIEKTVRRLEHIKNEKFTVLQEYGMAGYEQITKKIVVGDKVLKCKIYSQINKTNFEIRVEELTANSDISQKKAINFYDYYEPNK